MTTKKSDYLLRKALKYEIAGLKLFLSDKDDTDKLYELDKNKNKVIDILQDLLRIKSKKDVIDMIKDYNIEFMSEYEDSLQTDIEELNVLSEDLFGLDHLEFQWTLSLIDDAVKQNKKLDSAYRRLALAKGVSDMHKKSLIRSDEDVLNKIASKRKKKKKKKKNTVNKPRNKRSIKRRKYTKKLRTGA